MFTSLRSFGLSMVEKVISCMGLKWQTRKLLYVSEKQVLQVRVSAYSRGVCWLGLHLAGRKSSFDLVEKMFFFGGGGFPSLLCKRSNVSGATSKIQGAYKSREYLYRDRPLSEVLSWSWPWDLLASSARASRFVEEPKAGGGCMLERGNINVKTKATQKRFNSRCCST